MMIETLFRVKWEKWAKWDKSRCVCTAVSELMPHAKASERLAELQRDFLHREREFSIVPHDDPSRNLESEIALLNRLKKIVAKEHHD